MFTEIAAFSVSLIFGLTFGALVGSLGLPSPAPPTIAGVLAVSGSVFGIYLGVRLAGAIV
jgi:XapX domain-containing protein